VIPWEQGATAATAATATEEATTSIVFAILNHLLRRRPHLRKQDRRGEGQLGGRKEATEQLKRVVIFRGSLI
jgi:hypothetical protein